MKRTSAQGSLEYLIIIAAVLVVAGVTVLIVAGSAGTGKTSVLYSSCQEAATQCRLLKAANPNNPCSICGSSCVDPVSGEEIFAGAIKCCEFGNASAIYEGSPGCSLCGDGSCEAGETCVSCASDCGTCPTCSVANASVACNDNNECTDDTCPSGSCVNVNKIDGTLCSDDGNECTSDACSSGTCAHPVSVGAACGGGFGLCEEDGSCSSCLDSDGDGVDAYSPICPTGTDCAPTDATKWQNLTGYVDSDNDKYGVNPLVTVCSGAALPLGYNATNNTDCNDADATKWRTATCYPDTDGDGYGAGTGTSMCVGTACPSGYSSFSTDCAPSDATKWRQLTIYQDTDGDGYGSGAGSSQCIGAMPSGYSAFGTDCAPSDGAKWATYSNVYVDTDLDTYGAGSATSACCGGSLCPGYSYSANDCDNAKAYVNPGISETYANDAVCGNSLDDNCNSVTDCAESNCGYYYSCITGHAVGGKDTVTENGRDYVSINKGVAWAQLTAANSGNYSTSVDMYTQGMGLIVGRNGQSQYTNNGGSTWTTVATGTTNNLLSVDWCGFDGGSFKAVSVGTGGMIRLFSYFTSPNWYTPAGATGVTSETLYDVDCVPNSPNTGYVAWAAGTKGILLKGEGTGLSSWAVNDPGVTKDLLGVDFINASHGWLVGNDGMIVRTTTGGSSWNVLSSGTASHISAVDFINATHGWVVTRDGKYSRTTNGGTSWNNFYAIGTASDPFGSTDLTDVQMVNASEGFAVGLSRSNGAMVYKTTNGGGVGGWNYVTVTSPPPIFSSVDYIAGTDESVEG